MYCSPELVDRYFMKFHLAGKFYFTCVKRKRKKTFLKTYLFIYLAQVRSHTLKSYTKPFK